MNFPLLRPLVAVTSFILLAQCGVADDSAAKTATKAKSTNQAETGYVGVSRAFVYSGPSDDYYPTQQLIQGTAVEIYHRTESGWLGIRPPAGSFSWIPASDAFLLPGGRAIEITSGNSVSWIGSTLGTAKQYRWQVRLKSGEQLTKLGEQTIKDSEGKETLWYKIAPPNGEFRWIKSGAITREPPTKIANRDLLADGSVVPAGSTSKQRADNNVTSATHFAAQESVEAVPMDSDGFVLDGSMQAGEYIDGEIYDGQIIDGEIVDGDVIYDGVHDDGGEIIYEDAVPEHDANWNDWQLFEFTDAGLRFPFLERTAAWRNSQPDPLAADPFSLDLAPKKKMHMRPGLPELTQSAPVHRHTPWRDPRMLSQKRMEGYPQSEPVRGNGTTLSYLRNSLSPSGAPSNNPAASQYYDNAPTSVPGPTGSSAPAIEPHLAPPLDWSSRHRSDANGSVSSASGQFSSTSNAAATTAGSWTARNWFGLNENTSGLSLQPMMQATSGTLMELQQRLSEMVTHPMPSWNFADLKQRVQYFIANGASPIERGQARLLLERIGEFERHAMNSGLRLSDLNSNSPSLAITAPVQTASFAAPAAPTDSATMPSANFDATGWLVPVFAAQPGQPTHALKSDSGQIIAYVTAVPGMKLDRFVNEAVGVHGLKGYLPEFQAAHIEAQNVTRLR